MAIRPILILPDALLRKQSKPVERVDAELSRLIDDMFETMYEAPGIGLAAPQLRMHDEGCLSIPDFTAEIERPAKIRVAYIDREGKPEERELAGIWSTLVQHEIDHLNGILFIDYLSRLKRDMVVRKLSKQKRTEAL